MVHFSVFRSSRACLLLAFLMLVVGFPAVAQTWQAAWGVAVPTVGNSLSRSAVNATAVDAVGNVYVAGEFTQTVVLGNITLTSLGGRDGFVAKLNPATNQFVWAQRVGGTQEDAVFALAVSGTSVYVAGFFQSPSVGFGPTTLTCAGSNDAYVAKLTDAGTTADFVWAQQVGGIGNQGASALAVSGTSVYVGGALRAP